MARRFLATLAELESHPSAKFEYEENGVRYDGMVVLFEGRPRAWRNQCKHIGVNLDWGDNEFFDRDGKLLQCRTHGALYRPDTGLCVAGPCAGASLDPLPVEVEEGCVYAVL